MLESMNDVLSLAASLFILCGGLYILFMVSDKHRDEMMKKREENYYSLYEEMDDEFDDEQNEPYYE